MQQRMEILQLLEEGATKSEIMNNYGICHMTIWRIKRDAVKICQLMNRNCRIPQRKKGREIKHKDLDKQLYDWFLQQRVGDITDDMLQEKSLELMRQLYGRSNFAANSNWLLRFKKRHNIELLHARNKKIGSSDMVNRIFAREFYQRLNMEGINYENIYSINVTDLAWTVLPRRMLVSINEKSIENMTKDCVTIAFCANATGSHKLLPLFIHKYKDPKALSQIEQCKGKLPTVFRSQTNQEILAHWYTRYFKTFVRRRQLEKGVTGKVLLLVNNYYTEHIATKDKQDEQFEMIFLPANNTTSSFQPLDQEIVETAKRNYRYYMLKHMLDYAGRIREFHEKYNLKDCIDILYKSWVDVTSEDIKHSWRKLLREPSHTTRDRGTQVTDINLQELINNITGENVTLDELTNWLALCAKIEDESQKWKENTKDTLEERESKLAHLNNERMDKVFETTWTEVENGPVRLENQV